jgi:hypothetical protein
MSAEIMQIVEGPLQIKIQSPCIGAGRVGE